MPSLSVNSVGAGLVQTKLSLDPARMMLRARLGKLHRAVAEYVNDGEAGLATARGVV
jgi:hypothetical protein